jgi:hypothetical protein
MKRILGLPGYASASKEEFIRRLLWRRLNGSPGRRGLPASPAAARPVLGESA